MTTPNGRPNPPRVVDVPFKHVIDVYRHRAQQVTCVCGWEGSTASVMTEPSPWAMHVRDSKAGSR